MKHWVSDASAATLGYISGGMPGAAVGWTGRRVYKNAKRRYKQLTTKLKNIMAPVTPPRTPSKRKHESEASKSRKKKRSNKRGSKSKKKDKVVKREPRHIASGEIRGGIDSSSEFVKWHKMKRHKSWQYGGKFTYVSNDLGAFLNISGSQQVSCVSAQNTRSQMLTSTGPTYNSFQNATGYVFLDPNSQITGSPTFVVAAAGATPAQKKFQMLNNYFDLEVTNLSSVAADLDVYLFLCKKNCALTPDILWQQDLQNQGLGVGIDLLPGAGTPTGGTVGYTTINYPGERYPNKGLASQFWKLAVVKNMKLAPDATEMLNMKVKTNAKTSYEFLNSIPVDVPYIGGLTTVVMFVMRGSLVRDTTALGANSITYGSATLGYAFKKTVVMQNALSIGAINSKLAVSQATTSVTFANQKQLNAIDVGAGVQNV